MDDDQRDPSDGLSEPSAVGAEGGAGRLRFLVPLVPGLWLFLFFALPFAIVFKISMAESIIGQPPYSALIEWLDDGGVKLRLFFDNYGFLFEDPLYLVAYANSLRIAAISTVLCVLLGFPMAYAIARAPESWRTALLMMVVLPFWTSFLIRVYAWIGILKNNGLINNLLIGMGLIDQPLPLLHTEFSVFVGIVYSYLPFMILPLYATLIRLDPALLEAAADLGCKPFSAFLRVTLPQAVPGLIAGSLLVFIPAVGEFVIPDLLGGPETLMIGKLLWTEFFSNRDWPLASSVAVAMLVFLVAPIVIFQKAQERQAARAAEEA